MDHQLRKLSRDPTSVQALVARVRAGSLSQKNLELAAYCGHKNAQEIAGNEFLVSPGQIVSSEASFGPWFQGLRDWEAAYQVGHMMFVSIGMDAVEYPVLSTTAYESILEKVKEYLIVWALSEREE